MLHPRYSLLKYYILLNFSSHNFEDSIKRVISIFESIWPEYLFFGGYIIVTGRRAWKCSLFISKWLENSNLYVYRNSIPPDKIYSPLTFYWTWNDPVFFGIAKVFPCQNFDVSLRFLYFTSNNHLRKGLFDSN